MATLQINIKTMKPLQDIDIIKKFPINIQQEIIETTNVSLYQVVALAYLYNIQHTNNNNQQPNTTTTTITTTSLDPFKSCFVAKINNNIKYERDLTNYNPVSGVCVEPCHKCKSQKTTFIQKQIRRSDEPATTFYRCLDCGFSWKEN